MQELTSNAKRPFIDGLGIDVNGDARRPLCPGILFLMYRSSLSCVPEHFTFPGICNER